VEWATEVIFFCRCFSSTLGERVYGNNGINSSDSQQQHPLLTIGAGITRFYNSSNKDYFRLKLYLYLILVGQTTTFV